MAVAQDYGTRQSATRATVQLASGMVGGTRDTSAHASDAPATAPGHTTTAPPGERAAPAASAAPCTTRTTGALAVNVATTGSWNPPR
jgi:hypothetical protein